MMKHRFCMALVFMVVSSCGVAESPFSELSGAYDDQHILRLSPVGEGFRFETCLTSQEGEGGCVGALKDQEGRDLIFTLEDLSRLSLSDEEKRKLHKLSSDFADYQQALERRQRGRHLSLVVGGVGAGVGASGAWLIHLGQKKIVQDRSFLADLEARLNLADKNYQLSEKTLKSFHQELSQISSLWDDEILDAGETIITKQSLQDEIARLTEKLESLGYSSSKLPKSLVSLADQAILKEKKNIISDSLYNFLQDRIDVKAQLAAHDLTLEMALRFPKVVDLDWKKLIADFMMEGHDPVAVVDTRFLDSFIEFNRIQRSFLASTNFGMNLDYFNGVSQLTDWNTQNVESFRKALLSESSRAFNQVNMDDLRVAIINRPAEVFQEMNFFVLEKGFPSPVSSYVKEIINKKALLKTMSDIPDFFPKKSSISSESFADMMDVKSYLSKTRSDLKRLSSHLSLSSDVLKIFRKNLAIFVVSAAVLVTGIIVFSEQDVHHAQRQWESGQIHHDQLQVMLSGGSDLMSVAVPSIAKILESLSLWNNELSLLLKEGRFQVKEYCLPAFYRGSLRKQCYSVSGG